MTGITDSVLSEIKLRTDLADLIASYGIAVRINGASKKACCPFHHEKTPSFNINDSKGFYHCFGCGESGDAIKFVQKMEGLTFVEAVRKLAARAGVKIEEREDPEAGRRKRLYALMAEVAAFYRRCLLQTREAEPARAYLTERDLGAEIQEAWQIGYAPSGIANILKWAEKNHYSVDDLAAAGIVKPPQDESDRGYHRFGGRLMFTIRDKQGRVVAFSGRQLVASKHSGKYVNSPETPIFKKSNVLFGFDKAAGPIAKSPHREAIVCEGQIDTIRLHAAGFPVAVASQGTAFTEEHVRMLHKVADQVALVFDDDAAGHKATIRTAGLFLAEGMPVRVVSLPGGDDPDSFLRAHPAADFQKLLDGAESIMAFQIRAERAKESVPDAVDAVSRITKSVIATIAQSQSAVIRAGMTAEAAKILGLPGAALNEELEKWRSAMPTLASRKVQVHPDEDNRADSADADGAEVSPEFGAEAARVLPPPPCERALCAFLLANEYDATLDGMVGEFLPGNVFAHDFTRRFIEVWRTENAKGEDLLAPWRETLESLERGWFDRLLLTQCQTESSGLSATDVLQDFIRTLWADYLRRLRDDTPDTGEAAADARRLDLTMTMKRLAAARWAVVKEIIRAANFEQA